MSSGRLAGMVEASYAYFQSLGAGQDPAGVEAVRRVRDRMIGDLEACGPTPSPAGLAKLCREWRGLRIDPVGAAAYLPDMFVESVCEVIELS